MWSNGQDNMSRGLGKIERKIIEALKTKEYVRIAEIRNAVYGGNATESQKQTLWRSIRKLHDKGIVGYTAQVIMFRVWDEYALEMGYNKHAYRELCLKRRPYRAYYLSG